MASESKGKTNRQPTITFTLPLSCQVCLGKVKQPVLCPNHHVFCQLCMEIWLEKNKQCPTCRVEINESNPVKNIIGGQLEDEDVRQQSSAELRRARFELLYKEYEDQFDQMRKESIILRTENNILLAQLQDAEDKNVENNETDTQSSSSTKSKNEPNLLMLTKNLQEAQTLYTGIKEEMTQLKQENSKLKDENVNLTRENETLRLEIAQRSPKKFGRYTVATLETKVSEYEKEIRQLKKALERSDEYVEDLERQINKLSQSRNEQQHPSRMKMILNSKEELQCEMNGHLNSNNIVVEEETAHDTEIYKERKLESVFIRQGSSTLQDRETAKRILFSLTTPSVENFNDKTEHTFSKSESDKAFMGQAGSSKPPDSIMKRTERGKSDSQCNGTTTDMHEKVTKKVHFNVPVSPNNSCSFDLEMPSPYGKGKPSIINTLHNTINDKNDKGRGDSGLDENVDEVDGDPSSDFDKHVVSLLKKAKASFLSSNKFPSSEGLGTRDEVSNDLNSRKSIPTSNSHIEDYSNDSSRLSMPDFDSPRKPPSLDSDGFSDSPRKLRLSQHNHLEFADEEDGDIVKTDDNSDRIELDISWTPEMSDCLRLMNQAERKLEKPSNTTVLYPDRGTSSISSSKYEPVTIQLTNNSSVKSKSASTVYNSTSLTKHPVQSYSSAETLRSWEQDFFRGLQANPYKQYRPGNTLPSYILSDNSSLNEKLNKSMPFSQHNDYASGKKSPSLVSHNADFINPTSSTSHNSNTKSYVSTTPSNLYSSSANTNTYGSGIGHNLLSSHVDKHSSVTSQIPFSLSSTDQPYGSVGLNQNSASRDLVSVSIPPPSSSSSTLSSFSLLKNPSNQFTTSATAKDHHYTFSSLFVDSSSVSKTASSQAYHNPLPPSLNNSSLEWPESPAKNLISENSGFGNSATLFRDNNRSLSSGGAASPRNFRKQSQDHIYTSASSSYSSDINNSSFLPEPKKRLFTIDDDLDLSMPSKTAKKMNLL